MMVAFWLADSYLFPRFDEEADDDEVEQEVVAAPGHDESVDHARCHRRQTRALHLFHAHDLDVLCGRRAGRGATRRIARRGSRLPAPQRPTIVSGWRT